MAYKSEEERLWQLGLILAALVILFLGYESIVHAQDIFRGGTGPSKWRGPSPFSFSSCRVSASWDTSRRKRTVAELRC